jgi:hypothetical protein
MRASRRVDVIVLLVTVFLVVAGVVFAQGGYDLSWWTVDGGGDTLSTGPGYSLGGTIGQPDAGPALSGPGYRLTGGFWLAGARSYGVYLPVVQRAY